ncbi:MAG TPA: type II toxin-antitoxin system VapC family toxin [Chloroflexota bacterium]|nr:type II toxin-antitoxin system VapC family toxin [Chloroflexota bacterium]
MGASALTKLDSALSGVSSLGIETSPFIYFIERHPAYVSLLREVFRRMDVGIIAGFSSVITLTEVITKPKQEGNNAIAVVYRNLLLHSRHFTLVPIDATVAEHAADLRAHYRLRTPDALQVATAITAGCQAFLTNDHALRRITGIKVLVLAELEL